jgi:hypothetical protein
MTDKEKMIGGFTVPQFQQTMRIYNANENFANAGFEQQITTTTQMLAKVLETDYYELNGQKLSDFTPIEAGFGAFSTEISQFATKATGTDFKACLINPTAGAINQDGHTDIEVGNQKYPNNFFRDTFSISREGMEIASRNLIPFDIYEQKERARKKKFQLGLQEAWFLGLGDGRSFGLLNQPDAIVDTFTMQKNLSEMTDDEFATFVSTIRGYYDNVTNSTAMFDRLMLPQQEYFKLDKIYGSFGLSRRSILEDVMKETNGKIVYTRYNATAGTSNKGRYALYKADPDYIEGFIPLDYTPYPLYPVNALDMVSNCMAQFSTPNLKRKNTLVYLDVEGA